MIRRKDSKRTDHANELRSRGYVPTSTLIVLLEITRGHFDKEIKPFIAPADVKELANGSKYYRFRAVVDLFVERATKRNGTSRGKDSDPIIDRLKIEQLEQRNRIEALRIEDLEQKRRLENGNLLTLADVQETLLPAAQALRKLGDQMGVKDMVSGREVQRRINAAIESLGTGIDRL